MDYRSLGRTGISFSPLCLGAMVPPGHTVDIRDEMWQTPTLDPSFRRR